jgi:NAD(P)H dehydrogenase (quinone)
VVGLPYAVAGELFDISEARGGSPYGAGMLAGPDGARQPSELERTLVRKQGGHVARIAAQLLHGRAALDRAA